MSSVPILRRARLFVVTLLLFTTWIESSSAAGEKSKHVRLACNESTIIRFFLQSPNSDFLRPPIVLRVAKKGSSELMTAPINVEGRSAYVTVEEMREIMNSLQTLDVSWSTSKARESVIPYIKMPRSDDMLITVFSSDGTAKASIPPGRICEVLAKMNAGISSHRAHWQFGYFRGMCSCKVPGFNWEEYPDV
jgi:hypothetical protein